MVRFERERLKEKQCDEQGGTLADGMVRLERERLMEKQRDEQGGTPADAPLQEGEIYGKIA